LTQSGFNALQRGSAEAAGWEFLATRLPLRFTKAGAAALGYRTSQKRSKIASRTGKYDTDEGLTYDERKRQFQGHDNPLAWTGAMRVSIHTHATSRATAVKGEATLRIGLGPLNVSGRSGGVRVVRQLPAANIARKTLLAPFTGADSDAVGQAYRRAFAAQVEGLSVPTKRLPPPPAVVADRVRSAQEAQQAMRAAAEVSQVNAGARMAARYREAAARRAGWSAQSGGSAPIGGAALTMAERAQRHRMQSASWYRRNRSAWNAKRRIRARQLRAAKLTMRGAIARARRLV
jgi:hypothetical protein